MINASICLSEIPKEKITVSEKNGKKYLSIVIDERKEKDQYGNTHTIFVSQSKEEREAKTPKSYIGNGKLFLFEQKPVSNTPHTDVVLEDSENDLPW